jgi:hypothetical protein
VQHNVTPVSTATQSVSRLQTLLAGRQSSPSETLLELFRYVMCVNNTAHLVCFIWVIPPQFNKFQKINCTQYYQILYNLVCKKCCHFRVIMLILRVFCELALKAHLLLDNSVLHRNSHYAIFSQV